VLSAYALLGPDNNGSQRLHHWTARCKTDCAKLIYLPNAVVDGHGSVGRRAAA
jgi:hypothetical protein